MNMSDPLWNNQKADKYWFVIDGENILIFSGYYKVNLRFSLPGVISAWNYVQWGWLYGSLPFLRHILCKQRTRLNEAKWRRRFVPGNAIWYQQRRLVVVWCVQINFLLTFCVWFSCYCYTILLHTPTWRWFNKWEINTNLCREER